MAKTIHLHKEPTGPSVIDKANELAKESATWEPYEFVPTSDDLATLAMSTMLDLLTSIIEALDADEVVAANEHLAHLSEEDRATIARLIDTCTVTMTFEMGLPPAEDAE